MTDRPVEWVGLVSEMSTLRALPLLEPVELAVLLAAVDRLAVEAGLPATPFIEAIAARLGVPDPRELSGLESWRTTLGSLRTAILEALSAGADEHREDLEADHCPHCWATAAVPLASGLRCSNPWHTDRADRPRFLQ